MLTQADITLIIAALQFWAEEMDPEDEQCLRIYAETPEAEQTWKETAMIRRLVRYTLSRKLILRDPLEGLQNPQPRPTEQPCYHGSQLGRTCLR